MKIKLVYDGLFQYLQRKMDLLLVQMKMIYLPMKKTYETKLINLMFVAMNFIQSLRSRMHYVD